jgi:hypothetical protein
MLLSHCPNCQHDNKPGERFCAACGVPLDLKPCPACGKVDDVKARICTGCGAAFPPVSLTLGDDESLATELARPRSVSPPVVAPPSSPIRALPLIIVALAAGGIPLLWLYRNNIPVPKVWQPPSVQSTDAAAVAPPTLISPPAPVPEPASVPAAAVPALEPATSSTPARIPLAPEPSEATAQPPVVDEPEVAPVAKHGRAKKHAARSQSAQPKATAHECSEALAAVGLCDPKAGQ